MGHPEEPPMEVEGDSVTEESPPSGDATARTRTGEPTRLFNADPSGTDDDDDWLAIGGVKAPQQLGKYAIEGPIGRGGMGVVLKGHDPDLGRTVAIKVLAPHLAQSPTARRRFQREARAAAAISHPHVLTIHHVEEENETPFLVMEYVAGGSLKEYVASHGKLDPVQVIQLSCQIAQGLAAAHAQGVIHRDVKPGNVMLHEGGMRVRLADFGLARVASDNADLTSHDQAVGTPAYMAPEQLRGRRIDARADLFSLGCVMHYMLLGHSPFQGRTQAETIHKILGEPPRPLLETDPTIPPALAEIVDRLLRKDPDERYQSAFEVAAVLERYLTLVNQAPTDEIADILARPALFKNDRRRRKLMVGGIAGGLAALSLILFILFRPPPTPADGETEQTASTNPEDATVATATRPPRNLTVAREGEADFRSLREAVDAAQSGDTVRVLDDETYALNLNLQNARQLVLETTAGAQLVPQNAGEHVIQVHGGEDITIRGFRITTTSPDHHAVLLTECSGVRLEDLMIRQETARAVAAIRFDNCNPSPDSTASVIRGCVVESLSTGQCLWVHAEQQPVWNLTIEGNRFTGMGGGTLAVLWGQFGSVNVRNNVFAAGYVGLNLNLMRPENADPPGLAVQLAGNTFFDCRSWLGLIFTQPAVTPFVLANNLILDCETVEASAEQQRAVADHCTVEGNVWERASLSAGESEYLRRWARFEPKVDALSRDPMDAEFLRLPEDSPFQPVGVADNLPDNVDRNP